DSLAYACAMNPPPTTRRSTNGDHSGRDDRLTTARSPPIPFISPCPDVTSPASTSVVRVPLLPPWISVVVVSVALPEPWLVLIQQRQAAHPLGALPKIEVGDEQPGRATVFRRQIRAVEAERDPGLPVPKVTQRQVRRV